MSDNKPRESISDGLTTATSMLEGELLTIADAFTADLEQRKALKSLIRQTVWRWEVQNRNLIMGE